MHFETTFFHHSFSSFHHNLITGSFINSVVSSSILFFSSLRIINQLIPPLYTGCGLPPNESANEIRGAVDPSAGPDRPGPRKNGPPPWPHSLSRSHWKSVELFWREITCLARESNFICYINFTYLKWLVQIKRKEYSFPFSVLSSFPF